jgi:hypothetical protein
MTLLSASPFCSRECIDSKVSLEEESRPEDKTCSTQEVKDMARHSGVDMVYVGLCMY